MKHFTKSQIEEIKQRIATDAVRDSEFTQVSAIQPEDSIPILHSSDNSIVTYGVVKKDVLDAVAAGIDGKILSSNDYTDADKAKLGGVATGAQVNVIEGVKVNGSDLPLDSSKKVNVIVPDVSQFITKSVNNLINYYRKSEVYTKEEVDYKIIASENFHYEVYASIQEVTQPAPNILYLIGPLEDETEGENKTDRYQEWVYSHDEWVQIGDTSIDLSDYITTAKLNTALAAYQETLVSGTNIKTVNGQTIVGSGNLEVGDLNAVKFIDQTLTDGQKTQARTNIEAGTYSKPSGGIPKTDLASGVQASLDLADSAIQAEPVGSVTPAIDPYTYATKSEVSQLGQYETTSEDWIRVITDNDGRVLGGIRSDGSVEWMKGIPSPVRKYVDSLIEPIREYVNESVEEIKSIIYFTEDSEFVYVILDSEEKILYGIRYNGSIYNPLEKKSIEKEIGEYILPNTIFEVWNAFGWMNKTTSDESEYTREYSNIIYPDRIYRKGKALFDGVSAYKVLANSTRWRAGNTHGQTVLQESIPLVIGGNGYEKIKGNVTLITTKNSAAIGKNLTLMAIGDSITEDNGGFWTKVGNFSFPIFMQELFRMDDIDYQLDEDGPANSIQCHLIGTRPGYKRKITYRGIEIDNSDACCEGRGGWSIVDYLRYPYGITDNYAMYDILGLRTRGAGYDNPHSLPYQEVCQTVGNTCWGVYHAGLSVDNMSDVNLIITEDSWNGFKNFIGASQVSWANATEAQKKALFTWATETIVNTPINPFYDKNAYDSDTNTMFSWDTYYSRTKTVENDGVTPLSEMGSWITPELAEYVKVCVPKFFTIELGTNDVRHQRPWSDVMQDTLAMASILQSQATIGGVAPYIVVVDTGYPASQIPELHPNSAQLLTDSVQNSICESWDMHKAKFNGFGNISSQISSKVVYCPSYFVQGFDTSRAHKNIGLSEDAEFTYTWCLNDVHPGPCGNMQIGYQLYSLIMYIFSL